MGRLTHDPASHQYEFCYIWAVHQAQVEGFDPFLEFPDLDAVYRGSELFPLFANRVMPAGRPDRAEFLRFLGLTTASAGPMAVLARTGGRRQTDQVELFPLPVADGTGCFVTHCLLRAVRYMPPAADERVQRLTPGERLYLMWDAQNPADPHAVAVRTEDNHLIGYMPSYLGSDLSFLNDRCESLVVTVEQVNPPPAEAHHRLLCKITSCWPDDFRPLADDKFRPLGQTG